MNYIFGGNTGLTYADIQRRRARVAQSRARAGANVPRNLGEGLAGLGQALADRFEQNQLNKAEKEGREQFQSAFRHILSGQSRLPVAAMSQGSAPQAEQSASQDGINWSPYLIDGALREDAISGLTPDTRANVARLMQAADSELGPGLQIYSAYRSPELQKQLFDKAIAKYGSPQAARKWVAPPGRSKHNSGQAVDLKFKGTRLDQADPTIAAWVKTNAPKYGLNVPMEWEPWQVELAGARDEALPLSEGRPSQAGMGNSLGVDPRLLAIYGNDFATPQQKMIMDLMVQKQMRENEPAPKLTPMQELQLERARVGLQKDQLQLDQMRNPQATQADFTSPIQAVDADGNPVFIQANDRGEVKQVEGFTPSNPIRTFDTGTEIVTINSRTGEEIGRQPKANQEAATQTARGRQIGQAEGQALASANSDMGAANTALDLVDQIRNSPNKARGTGLSSLWNAVPNTRGRDFQNLVDQATGTAFMQAVQQLRGLGGLSNTEGQAATAAIARISTTTSEEAFDKALADFEKHIRRGLARAQSLVSQLPDDSPLKPQATPETNNVDSLGVDVSAALEAAQNAIAQGAPREAVIKRLQDIGVDTGGL